jgi:hypothetical protein
LREHDDSFDEPDDLDRVERAIAAIETINCPVEAAAVLAYDLSSESPWARGELPCVGLGRRQVIPAVAVEAVIDGCLDGYRVNEHP